MTTKPRKATHVVQMLTNTGQPLVREIELSLADVCTRYDGDLDRACALLTALLMTSVNACKSFGVHPRNFIAQFETVYADTAPPAVIPVIDGSDS